MNSEGNLLACVVGGGQHCVHIYSVVDLTADDVVGTAGTPGTSGSAHGQLNNPTFVCFVRRNGIHTLLIADTGNDRVVEVTASGVFLRAIAVKEGSRPFGVAERDGVIAVSLCGTHAVVLLQYESGAVKHEVTIGSGTRGRGNGQLYGPMGVTFTADGRCILVADCFNARVCKFSTACGAFIALVATTAANGILWPRDVIQCEDGSIVVAEWKVDSDASVVCVGEDGITEKKYIIPSAGGEPFAPFPAHSLSNSPSLNGVVVKTIEGKVFLLRDAWICGSRCAWLSAVVVACD